MAKTEKNAAMLSDTDLEGLLRAARQAAPVPPDDLMARILADADTELAGRAPAPAVRPVRRGRLAALLAGLGGWPAVAGMMTAMVAGVWIGFASPDQLNDLSGGLLLPTTDASAVSYELEDMLPGYGTLEAFYEEG